MKFSMSSIRYRLARIWEEYFIECLFKGICTNFVVAVVKAKTRFDIMHSNKISHHD